MKGSKLALALFLGGFAGLTLYSLARARAASARVAGGGFTEVDGVSLRFLDEGSGLPVIMLHGNGSAIEDFTSAGIIQAAAREYRVIAFDRPGFGGSGRAGRLWWTPAAQADLIHTALIRMGIERYVVLGHSWGTLVALQLALRHGPHVAGLVLVSGYYYPSQRPDLLLAAFPAIPIIGTILRASVVPLVARMAWPIAMKKIFGPWRVPARFSQIIKELATRPSQLKSIAAGSGLLLAEAFLRRPYSRIAVPTGIAAGKADRLID